MKIYLLTFLFIINFFQKCFTAVCESKPIGLENCGNSCYFNSILQSMFKFDIITNFLLHPSSDEFYKDNSLPHFYRDFVNFYNQECQKTTEKIKATNPTLKSMYDSIISTGMFEKGQQEDAQQMFSTLLNSLCSREFILDDFTIRNEVLAKCPQYTNFTNNIKITQGQDKDALVDNMLSCAFKQAELGKSLYDYFNIKIKEIITCLACKKQLTQNSNNSIIQINIEKSVEKEVLKIINGIETAVKETTNEPIISIQEALNDFKDPEVLTGDNQLYCINCKQKQNIAKESIITTTPEYLVIQLKIFDFAKGKIIHVPNLNINNLTIQEFPNCHYELFASSWHAGDSLQEGHYIAILKSGDNWYGCDDSTVDLIQSTSSFEDKIFTGILSDHPKMKFTPYVLFYKRVTRKRKLHN